ncbi:MAG TPA: glycosyltransferase family 4 protein [Candidatus Dormibacteraeota bacterium]|nr:glycosyltransferase family 4 protein [Candidatus Dormibacteraeota bacterium]
MKVVFPYPGYWPYLRRGVERCIHDLAGHLASRGHQVHVVASTPGRSRTAWDGDVKVTYVGQLSHPLVFGYAPYLRIFAFAAAASRVLASERADVAHLATYSIPWAPLLRRFIDLPYLSHLTVRGERIPKERFSFVTDDPRRADLAAALTEGAAREVEAQLGIDCEVLPPPVNLVQFRPVGRRDPRRPEVLFPADLADPLKGGLLLLEAWNEVHRRCPEAVLVLAGPYGLAGWDQQPLEMTAAGGGDLVGSDSAKAAIEFRGVGEPGSLPAWYSRAAVTVLPSVGEAFGMVLTESLACGTPVVGSAGEGPGEIIGDRGVGRTVDLGDRGDRAGRLATAILEAIELSRQPATRARCREWASQWGLDVVGSKEERLLEQVLSSRRGRG